MLFDFQCCNNPILQHSCSLDRSYLQIHKMVAQRFHWRLTVPRYCYRQFNNSYQPCSIQAPPEAFITENRRILFIRLYSSEGPSLSFNFSSLIITDSPAVHSFWHFNLGSVPSFWIPRNQREQASAYPRQCNLRISLPSILPRLLLPWKIRQFSEIPRNDPYGLYGRFSAYRSSRGGAQWGRSFQRASGTRRRYLSWRQRGLRR